MSAQIKTGVLLIMFAVFAGCRSYAERGAVAGGVIGGLTGAALGSHSGNSAEGAFWGGAIGSLVGAAAGDNIDADLAEREALAAQQAAAQRGPQPVSLDEITTMVRSGVGEPVIINHIRNHGVAAPLTANDIVMLHQQGLSDNIISAMQQASVRPVPVAAPPPVVIHEHVPPPVYWGPYAYHVHRPRRPGFRWGISVCR